MLRDNKRCILKHHIYFGLEQSLDIHCLSYSFFKYHDFFHDIKFWSAHDDKWKVQSDENYIKYFTILICYFEEPKIGSAYSSIVVFQITMLYNNFIMPIHFNKLNRTKCKFPNSIRLPGL